MKKQEIENFLNQLNLEADCFTGTLSPIIKKLKSKIKPQIKLYDTICDACSETEKFTWYLLEEIIEFNINRNIIPFHDCQQECDIKGCVVSLIVYIGGRTAFTKINKIEIIYI